MIKRWRFLVLCSVGLLASITNAQFEIISNPYGLDLRAVNGDGIAGWPYWDTDTFEQLFDSGFAETYLNPSGIAWGDPDLLVDGDDSQAALVMYDGWSTAFTLKQNYDGPRTLGNDGGWGHAIRIGISDHENSNRFHFEVSYTTVYDQANPKVLFEVRDLDPDVEWRPYCVYVNTNSATSMIKDIKSIYLKSYEVEQQTGSVSGVQLREVNISFVKDPDPVTSNTSVLSNNDVETTTPAWVDPSEISFTDTDASYEWISGDITGLGNDSGSLQDNKGSWEAGGAVWSSWDPADTIFEFDLQDVYLIEQFSLVSSFSGILSDDIYERGLGRVTVYVSEDGRNYDFWGQWADDSEPNIPITEAHRYSDITNSPIGARYVRCEVSRFGDAGIYHQMVLEEVIINGQTLPNSISILSGNDPTQTSPAWVNPLSVNILDNGSDYSWVFGDADFLNNDTTAVLQSNTGSWTSGGAVWGSWGGTDISAFEFDLKKQSLITMCSLASRFSAANSGGIYNEGIGRVDVYLSADGANYKKWANWIDTDPNASPGAQNGTYTIALKGPAMNARYVRYIFSKTGGIYSYRQAVMDEAIIWGSDYVLDADLDGDSDVDDIDLGLFAGDWLTDAESDVIADNSVDDFEFYTGLLDGAEPLTGSWSDAVWATGASEIDVEQNTVESGLQSMKWRYETFDTEQYSEILLTLDTAVDISSYDELRIALWREAGNLPMGLLYVKFLTEGTTEFDIASEYWLYEIQGSTYYPVEEWNGFVIDLNNLDYQSGNKGYSGLQDMTAVKGILIGTCCGEATGSGVIYIDNINLVDLCEGPISDITGDCLVNIGDYAKIANDWLSVIE